MKYHEQSKHMLQHHIDYKQGISKSCFTLNTDFECVMLCHDSSAFIETKNTKAIHELPCAI